ncbi:MAG: hypothetical protein ABIQ01_05260 [Pseudolysinimonas sp.]
MPGPLIIPHNTMNAQKKNTGPELWNAHLELAQPIIDAAADHLMDALAAYGVSVGSGAHNHGTVTITVPAENISQAFSTAIAVAERASGLTIVGAEVLPTDEFDARSGLEPIPALVSVAEAASMLGVTKVRANQMIGEGKFRTARRVGKSFVIAYREVADMAGIRDPLDSK